MNEFEGPLFEMESLVELEDHLLVMKEDLIEELGEMKTRSSEILMIIINKLLAILDKTENLNTLPLNVQVEFMAYLHLFIEHTDQFDSEWDDGFDDEYDEELEEELSTLEEEEE